jgi:hypothetical protein
VVLEAPPPLCSLFARLEGVTAVAARGDALPDFDVYCPAGSLPRALRTDVSSIPADVPYLRASEAHIAKWRERIDRLPQPRIAVAWAGSADHVNDRNRSLQLRQMAPLFALNASFVSIQRDLRAADAGELTRQPALMHVGDALADFDDTAAVVTLAARPPDLRAGAVLARLALDARAQRYALVPDHAAMPATEGE